MDDTLVHTLYVSWWWSLVVYCIPYPHLWQLHKAAQCSGVETAPWWPPPAAASLDTPVSPLQPPSSGLHWPAPGHSSTGLPAPCRVVTPTSLSVCSKNHNICQLVMVICTSQYWRLTSMLSILHFYASQIIIKHKLSMIIFVSYMASSNLEISCIQILNTCQTILRDLVSWYSGYLLSVEHPVYLVLLTGWSGIDVLVQRVHILKMLCDGRYVACSSDCIWHAAVLTIIHVKLYILPIKFIHIVVGNKSS